MEWIFQERRVVMAFALGVALTAAMQFLLLAPSISHPPNSASLSWETRQNLVRSKAWMQDNARRNGIIELPNGVQYRTIAMGHGKKVLPGQMLSVGYSENRLNESAEIPPITRTIQIEVDKALPGLKSVLLLMRVGSEMEAFVPPDMAFGTEGRPGVPSGSAVAYRIRVEEIL